MRYFSVLVLAMAMLLPASGCGRNDSLDLQAVAGKVSLDSRPLEHGSVQFCPVAKNGLMSGSVIAAGRYQISKSKGLPPGKYIVQISSADSSGVEKGPVLPGPGTPPLKELIPIKYNLNSELKIEVKSGGGNVFDFDLSSRVGK